MANIGAEESRTSVTTKATRRKSLTGTRRSSKTSVKSSMEIVGTFYTLDLEILGLKNVISKRYPIEVNLSVFYKQKLITTTPSIVVRHPGKYDLNYDFKFRIRRIDAATLDQLISEPLLFVLTKLRQGEKNQFTNFSIGSKGRSERFKNKLDLLLIASGTQKEEDTEKIEVVKKLVEEEETPLPKVIGECTLDLLPLVEGLLPFYGIYVALEVWGGKIKAENDFQSVHILTKMTNRLGESIIEEELLLERPVRDLSLPLRIRPLNSRTVLFVRVSDRSEMTKNMPPLHNYLMYTVESLYNLNLESMDFNDSSVISATIPFPLNVPNKVNDRELILYHFEPGIVTYSINIDYKKKWYGLANFIRGKGAYSKHRIPIRYKNIKNETGLRLKEHVENRNARVNWNIMRRIYLTPENEDVFMHNLIEYKYLPVEIVFDLAGTIDLKDDLRRKEGSRSSVTSRKLSTGSIKRDRSRREFEIVESEEANYEHFVAFLDVTDLLQPGVKSARVAALVKRFSAGEYREKWNVTESTLQFYLAPMDDKFQENLFIKGKPCFIIAEISLLHPLVPEKESLGWEKSLQELVTEKPISILEKLTIPMDHFAQVVKFTIFLIKREMEDFYKLKHSQYSELAFYKEMDFTGHLEHSGAMKMVTETLRKGITEYVHNVIGPPLENMDSKAYNDYLKITYFKIVDKVYQVIKTLSNQGDVEKTLKNDSPNMDELLLYAVEAGEQLNYPKARYYLTKRMELNGYRNADYWFDYGIMALRFGDMYLALESMKEVIAINPRHRMGLLVYAILLTVMGEYEAAETFFYATVKFYPNFWQAWVTFHVFYKLIELSEGADVTFVMGMRYMNECKMNEEWQPHLPLLTWYIDVCECFNVFLETAKFLLRYNLFEFAEMCLAEYLENENKKDACYYYYLSVCHFIQGRYADSLKHLEELMAQNETDSYKVWALIGYNYHNLGDNEEAIRAFNEVIKCLTDYSEIPLILIRLGFDLIEKNCAVRAKEIFLEALKFHSTPLTWIGLGVSCYLLEEMENAENAFIEANAMDDSLAIVWTYLGLIFLQRHYLFLYVQCLTEAKKCGLEDKRLFEQLEALQDIYSSSSSSQSIGKNESNYSTFKCFPKCCDTL